MLFYSSKPKHPPAPLSICQAAISFSNSIRNLGFYLDKDLSTEEHSNLMCKTAFLGIRRIDIICHYLNDNDTKILVAPLVL